MSGKRLTTVVLALALIASWYFAGYVPMRGQLRGINQQIDVAEAQLADYQTTIAQLPVLIREGAEMDARKYRQNAALFAKEDVLRLFDEINTQAGSEQLSVVEITPPVNELLNLNAAAATPHEPLFLNVTVRVMGDYIGFGRFVGRVESLPYFRGVNTCSAMGTADKSAPVVYSLGFKALLRNSGGHG